MDPYDNMIHASYSIDAPSSMRKLAKAKKHSKALHVTTGGEHRHDHDHHHGHHHPEPYAIDYYGHSHSHHNDHYPLPDHSYAYDDHEYDRNYGGYPFPPPAPCDYVVRRARDPSTRYDEYESYRPLTYEDGYNHFGYPHYGGVDPYLCYQSFYETPFISAPEPPPARKIHPFYTPESVCTIM